MIKKIAKNSFRIVAILIVLFAYIATPIPVEASTKNPETLQDLKDNVTSLKKQKAENEAQKQETKNQIQAKKDAIAKAEKDIAKAEADIEEAERKIEESNERIEGLKEQTEKIMKTLQQLQNQNVYLEYISDSSSITEFVMRMAAIDQITSSNQKNLEELKVLIKQNEQLKVELSQKQKELEKKIPEYQRAIESLYGNLESYDKFELDIDTQIKLAEDQLKMYENLSKQKYGEIRYQATLVSLMADNYGWLKPLKSGRVTSTQGYRTHPITGAKYSFHSGIDIGGNAEGTPVYATASGRVSGIVLRYKCGGNMLYIDVVVNGKQYTTFFYHLLTINVKVGDMVTTDTVVGTVGGGSTSSTRGGYDTCTTGAHLHYGVMTGAYTGSTPASRVIVPPGFRNAVGYSFSSRLDYYGQ